MQRLVRTSLKTGLALSLATVFLCAGVGYALDVQLVPGTAQREIGGQIRVHIIATDVTDLISFGVEVEYNTCVLEVDQANTAKNTDFDTGFVMDPDGSPGGTQYTDPAVKFAAATCGDEDTFAPGTVKMMGGRLIGDSTTGLNAPLLGWITFTAVEEGESNLKFNLYNPTATFDNFVGLGGSVYDSTIPDYALLPAHRGSICVVANACYADLDGDNDVDAIDKLQFRFASPSIFPETNYNPAADIDADGDVDAVDKLRFRLGSPKAVEDCPVCP
jgi:hypothetical protein